jgi:hypothetical protein
MSSCTIARSSWYAAGLRSVHVHALLQQGADRRAIHLFGGIGQRRRRTLRAEADDQQEHRKRPTGDLFHHVSISRRAAFVPRRSLVSPLDNRR